MYMYKCTSGVRRQKRGQEKGEEREVDKEYRMRQKTRLGQVGIVRQCNLGVSLDGSVTRQRSFPG